MSGVPAPGIACFFFRRSNPCGTMETVTTLDIGELRRSLEAVADRDKVSQMTAYMKTRFLFLGVPSKPARQAAKPLLAASADASGDELIAFANTCWEQPEREFQYVATILLRKRVKNLESRHLPAVQDLLTTKPWWDTVDALAAWTVGPLVAADRALGAVMDEWIDGDAETDAMWLARTAILHQLSYKESTDQDRLFAYAQRRAADTEFFIRKAIGWALRQHARYEPEAVRAFVIANEASFSGLTVREALKRIGR